MGEHKFPVDIQNCLVAPKLSGVAIKKYRKRIGMSQREFSNYFDIPLGTLRRWEQEQSIPHTSRLSLLALKMNTTPELT